MSAVQCLHEPSAARIAEPALDACKTQLKLLSRRLKLATGLGRFTCRPVVGDSTRPRGPRCGERLRALLGEVPPSWNLARWPRRARCHEAPKAPKSVRSVSRAARRRPRPVRLPCDPDARLRGQARQLALQGHARKEALLSREEPPGEGARGSSSAPRTLAVRTEPMYRRLCRCVPSSTG